MLAILVASDCSALTVGCRASAVHRDTGTLPAALSRLTV